MAAKEKIILPYNLYLTITSLCLTALCVIFAIIAIFAEMLIWGLVGIAFLLAAAFVIIQNKKIVFKDERIVVKHFLGIIKDQSFLPVECGFFVSEASLKKPIYIDKRTLHNTDHGEMRKYIYLSEYVLSKQEMDGSQYIYGEPILILKYSRELYASLSHIYEFNSDPFKEAVEKTTKK